MSRPRIFISHSSKEPTAEEFRDKLAERLREKKYRVLLDKDDIELNRDWRSTINTWVGACDAAVLLLSQAALKSRYVAYEASLMSYRHTQEQGRFKLFPVYLAPVTEKKIANSLLGPSGVADVEAIPGGVPLEDAIEHILQYLEEHVSSPESVAERHARRLCGLIKDVGTVELQAAADRMGKDLEPWLPGLELPMKVALYLMAAGLDIAAMGVRAFRSRLPKDIALEEVMKLIATSWVDCCAASEVGKAERQPGLLALNCDSPRTAELYVIGSCDLPAGDPWRVVQVHGVVGDGGIEELKSLIRSSLAHKLGVTPAEVDKEAREGLEKKDPVIVTLPLAGMTKAALDALRSAFPAVTFFFLMGSEQPSDEMVRQSGLAILRPLLEPGTEQPFWQTYDNNLARLKRR
jgi:hypothetical protein